MMTKTKQTLEAVLEHLKQANGLLEGLCPTEALTCQSAVLQYDISNAKYNLAKVHDFVSSAMLYDQIKEPPVTEYLLCYVDHGDDNDPLHITSQDRDALLALQGNHDAIYLILARLYLENEIQLPAFDQIQSVTVELQDNPSDALAGENESVNIW